MTRTEAEEQLHSVIEYLEPRAKAWLHSDQPDDWESGVWDAYATLKWRLQEMCEYDAADHRFDQHDTWEEWRGER